MEPVLFHKSQHNIKYCNNIQRIKLDAKNIYLSKILRSNVKILCFTLQFYIFTFAQARINKSR